MAEVWFYHLTRDPAEIALPKLIGQALSRGWRIALRGTDRSRMEGLDMALWTFSDESFLPHGLAGGAQDALQPVLLTVEGQEAANAPDCLMAVDGAGIGPADMARTDLQRICIVFDAHDPDQMARARDQWRMVSAAGEAAQYWAQDDAGRWAKRQERPATK